MYPCFTKLENPARNRVWKRYRGRTTYGNDNMVIRGTGYVFVFESSALFGTIRETSCDFCRKYGRIEYGFRHFSLVFVENGF